MRYLVLQADQDMLKIQTCHNLQSSFTSRIQGRITHLLLRSALALATGAIENVNSLLRRDMPRRTDITNYTARDIDEIAWAVNSTPRKCLGYNTPAEAFLENLRCCT